MKHLHSINGYTLTPASGRGFYVQTKAGNHYVPSVTQVLNLVPKPALVDWAARMAADYVGENLEPGADKADISRVVSEAKTAHKRRQTNSQNKGISQHDIVAEMITGKRPKEGALGLHLEELLKGSPGGRTEALVVGVNPLDNRPLYAGYADVVIDYEWGDSTVLEVKTSRALYPNHLLQLAAYAAPLKADGALLFIHEGAVSLYRFSFVELQKVANTFNNMALAWLGLKDIERMTWKVKEALDAGYQNANG